MRLVRHLSFSNVIAVIALFIALGGAAYAGTKINGSTIVNKSIGGGKLKNETITANKIKKGTITSAQIAPGSIDSTQINVNTLTTVPSAQTATTATSAKTAETATKATSAITADEATEAGMAEEAENAKHAKEADTALHANEADVATTAANATHATDADTVEGESGEELRNELKVGCAGTPKPTEAYGGMCWEKTTRPINFWLVAVKTCGNAGGRLPLISELIAYLTHDGNTPGSDEEWSGSLLGTEKALTTDDNENVDEKASVELGYRCVYPLTN